MQRKKVRHDELDTLVSSINRFRSERAEAEDALQRDIAKRKLVEAALHESETRLRLSEERLKLAIDAASLGIWDWDVEQDRLVWDDSMYRLYGVRKEEFSGAFDAWSKCLVPEDVARAKADVEAALRGDREYLSDFKVRRADGEIRIIRGVAQIIRNADGKPVRMVGINRDVTDLINAERERVRANEAVQAAQAELAQVARLTTMGELAASIAHEISQPLAAVVSYGNGALRWLAQAPPNLEETKAALKGVVEAGNHAGEVFVRIRELLKHRKPEYATLDVNEAIRDVLALTGSALRSRSVVIQTTLAADLPLVLGDRVQLQQVIMNLAMNGGGRHELRDRPASRCYGSDRRSTTKAALKSRSGIRALESKKRSVIASLIHCSRPSPQAWAWGCRSVEELSRHTVAGSGLRRARRTAPNSGSRFPVRTGPRCLHNSWRNSRLLILHYAWTWWTVYRRA